MFETADTQDTGFFATRRGLLLGAIGVAGLGAGAAVVEHVWKRKDFTARLFNPFSLEKFELAAVPGLTGADGQPLPGFSSADLASRRVILNLWASYCPACREEHPLLMDLARRDLAPIYGADVKDRPEHARAFLAERGNPFAAVGADERAFLQHALGVRGVPATFVVGPGPVIELSVFGPLDKDIVEKRVLPALTKP
jgi:DsbE subfamily thiol:disulfide oxidoreductase